MSLPYSLQCLIHARLQKHHHCLDCDRPVIDGGYLCEPCRASVEAAVMTDSWPPETLGPLPDPPGTVPADAGRPGPARAQAAEKSGSALSAGHEPALNVTRATAWAQFPVDENGTPLVHGEPMVEIEPGVWQDPHLIAVMEWLDQHTWDPS